MVTEYAHGFYSWRFGPLMVSLLGTVLLYQKCINLLREQDQVEHKSTSIYIRNLRCFSLVQLFTYGPLITLSFIQETLMKGIGVKSQFVIENICNSLASLSGFLSIVAFACVGGLSYDDGCRENGDVDLTTDLV